MNGVNILRYDILSRGVFYTWRKLQNNWLPEMQNAY